MSRRPIDVNDAPMVVDHPESIEALHLPRKSSELIFDGMVWKVLDPSGINDHVRCLAQRFMEQPLDRAYIRRCGGLELPKDAIDHDVG